MKVCRLRANQACVRKSMIARTSKLVFDDIISLSDGSSYCYYYCYSMLLSIFYWCNLKIGISMSSIIMFYIFINNINIFDLAGFWPRGQNPRRHPRSPRVYIYNDKEYLLKEVRNVFVMGEAFSI